MISNDQALQTAFDDDVLLSGFLWRYYDLSVRTNTNAWIFLLGLLILSLGPTVLLWYQTNHERSTMYMALCSHASVAEGFIGYSACLELSEGRQSSTLVWKIPMNSQWCGCGEWKSLRIRGEYRKRFHTPSFPRSLFSSFAMISMAHEQYVNFC